MLEKCVLTILELNWNQRSGHKKTKIAKQVISRRRKNENVRAKCQKMNIARVKRAKVLFFNVKYANLWGFCCRRRRGCLSSLLI